MRQIAKLNYKDREALFRNTAIQMGINEAIIEKDFWVCWMLDYLFHRCKWKSNLAFKGGTSLSKAYDLIHRFSEDIDLILDWRVLGYENDEPWIDRSNTKQDLFNKEANLKAEKFLKDEFLPLIINDLSKELEINADCYIDDNDGQTVKFAYPKGFSDDSILQEIRLEFGALAAWTPADIKSITPYSAEKYVRLFNQPNTNILTVLPERTFWEKVTILHREAFREKEREFPSRYSRHYYDLYCMSKTDVKNNAFNNIGLLDKVVTFKTKFYRSPWARYDLAYPGTLRLMPPEYNMKKLRDDYLLMQNMLFGEKPSFEDVLESVERLELEINKLG